MNHFHFFDQWKTGEPTRLAASIGMRLTECSEGKATIEFDAAPALENPVGVMHGGVHSYVADTAIGFATFSTLKEGESFTSVDLKINFFRPVTSGKVIASAEILRRGATISYAECVLTDPTGKLIAKASSTLMTLRPRATQETGR